MKRATIAIVDAARARIYTYDHEREPPQQLAEVADLVNPGRRLRTGELSRDAHVDEMDGRFAKLIVGELDRIVREGSFTQLIVVASPNMLGELRRADGALHREGVQVDEIARDFVKLTSPQLHDQLAQLQLIPPRERLGARSAAR